MKKKPWYHQRNVEYPQQVSLSSYESPKPTDSYRLLWADCKYPTLQDLIDAAQKYFPDEPRKNMQVVAMGYDAEEIILERKLK